jgi:murein DD-endopeptidase MepM/ murein hydrolase activator NlpD
LGKSGFGTDPGINKSFTFSGFLFALKRPPLSMKNFTLFLLLLCFMTYSCNSGISGIFGKKTAHEKYEKKMDELDLVETPRGKEWKAASVKALNDPIPVALPFKMQGNFPPGKPRAIGLVFQARQGEQLNFSMNKDSTSGFIIYADLYKKDGIDAEHILSLETTSTHFSIDIEQTGSYILRLQPPLDNAGGYMVSVITGPSLGFPVSAKKANIGSLWGDNRDGGKRLHEGIDIFAPKGSAAVASADGYITSVGEEGLGGKTVWLRPSGKNYSLYYAHLDKQSVQQGQFVKKGETIGLVGNTGNAQHTPAHLHFGIYGYAGPVDPLPFVNKTVKTAASIDSKDLNVQLQFLKTQKKNDGGSIPANTILLPLAATAKSYIAELPDGSIIQVPGSSVKARSIKQKNSTLANTAELPSRKS